MARLQRPPKLQRYLTGRLQHYQTLIQAAKDYPIRTHSHYIKPFLPTGSEDQPYYQLMFCLLSLLKTMNVRYKGAILEVGSGPGWVTELLMGLGYEVDAIEPSEEFILIAEKRLETFIQHHRITDPPRVTFHCTTLEECTLPSETYDGILFYDVLHHIVDEKKGLEQCFRLLAPGGVIGIHEGAWSPENRALEQKLDIEMAEYGTLENPYSTEYLDYLLEQHGFTNIMRYYQVNGLFPADKGNALIKQVATGNVENSNIVTAFKPQPQGVTTRNRHAKTLAGLKVQDVEVDQARLRALLTVRLTNLGETRWVQQAAGSGQVRLVLQREETETETYYESRVDLPQDVPAGEAVTFQADFDLPPDYGRTNWNLDMVNENYFRFSSQGTEPVPVILPYATLAQIEVQDVDVDRDNLSAQVAVRLLNIGETTWLQDPTIAGGVTVALRQETPESTGYREAMPRHQLPDDIAPGSSVVLKLEYQIPQDYDKAPWYLDLVNEQYYWFSSRGTEPARIELR
jgi:2-polyprenyl-3-methyl-5-hydroxy-6-metoxy-1,4-benzoquinol methylase